MLISTKTLGSKKPLFADFSIPLPPDDSDSDEGGDDPSLRDVISRIVRHEVKAFRKRQSDRQFVRALTARQIQDAADEGKITMGGSEIEPQAVDEDEAVATAIVAFEDGLYLVIIDDRQFKDLDEVVFLTDDSRVTFVRLTMLSGG